MVFQPSKFGALFRNGFRIACALGAISYGWYGASVQLTNDSLPPSIRILAQSFRNVVIEYMSPSTHCYSHVGFVFCQALEFTCSLIEVIE